MYICSYKYVFVFMQVSVCVYVCTCIDILCVALYSRCTCVCLAVVSTCVWVGPGLMPCCHKAPDDEVVKPQEDGKKKNIRVRESKKADRWKRATDQGEDISFFYRKKLHNYHEPWTISQLTFLTRWIVNKYSFMFKTKRHFKAKTKSVQLNMLYF